MIRDPEREDDVPEEPSEAEKLRSERPSILDLLIVEEYGDRGPAGLWAHDPD